VDASGGSLTYLAPLVVLLLASMADAASPNMELAIERTRHAEAIAPALLAELLRRGVVFSARVSRPERPVMARERQDRTASSRTSVGPPQADDGQALRFRFVGTCSESSKSPQSCRFTSVEADQENLVSTLSLSAADSAVKDAELRGVMVGSELLRPLVRLADTILLEPDADSRSNWGKGH
jgi:hypothetical protein